MADVTNELMYELLKRTHMDVSTLKDGVRELRQDNLLIRNQIHGLQGEVNSLRSQMAAVENRLDRIENRLELRELAEAQARFEPHP